MQKKCTKCGEVKMLDEYHVQKQGANGRHPQCKVCRSEYKKQHYSKNSERYIEQSKKYYADNTEVCKQMGIDWRKLNKQKQNEKRRKRYWSDPKYRITNYLRSKLYSVLKNKKSDNTFNLIGCSPDEFANHIESKFTEGMTWDNYNFYGWHIDHVIPCNAFDLTKAEEQRKCFHYTNLQPLWAKENLCKNDRNVII